ncbi:MAG: 30S ribosome-binding factor RbfA [Actinomycetota bacterium]|nr:30S ribosome-binding factor RbfA [Actinomycetota bacterium]
MREPKGGRRYPRMARVNELVREVLAEEIELLQGDERIGLLTVTHVEVDPDLRRATVLLSSLEEEAEVALMENRARLQATLARQVRLRRTPQLAFMADPAIQAGTRVEDILRGLGEASAAAGETGAADDTGSPPES